MRRIFGSLAVLGISVFMGEAAYAQQIALPNASFETAGSIPNRPSGWTTGSASETAWDKNGRNGSRAIGILRGKANETVFWKTDALPLAPNTPYRLSFWGKGTGSIISGLNVANRDYTAAPHWQFFSHVFVTPTQLEDAYLRLGQWSSGGPLWFDDVKLARVQALHTPITTVGGTLELGEGETMVDGAYRFTAPLKSSNFSRPLHSATAGFNTDRWVLGSEASIVYRHRIGDFSQSAARVRATIGYYRGGRLIAEASRDGNNWTSIGELDKSGVLEAPIPASLLPATEVWIRLRAAAPARGGADSSPGAFQINAYSYEATVAGAPDARGGTRFLEETVAPQKELTVRVDTLGALLPGGGNVARFAIQSHITPATPAQLVLTLQNENTPAQKFTKNVSLKSGANTFTMPYEVRSAGPYTANIALVQNGRTLYGAATDFYVPALFAADYGQRIGTVDDVWWANAPHKISRERPLPAASANGSAIAISAAKNEYEPFQIVARPTQDVRGLKVSASALTGGSGAKIAAENIEICEVAYLNVTQPTDETGTAAAWPDPLPPHKQPLDLKANRNQPFWVTVRVPKNARAGIYRGTITLAAPNWKRSVPLQLTVRNFALTDETHVQSGFGLSHTRLRRYHNVTSDEDLARVMEKYYENFAAHRIAPYNPTFGAEIKVDWGLGGATSWRGGAGDRTAPFAGAYSFKVSDDKIDASTVAEYSENIPLIPGKKYTLRFAAKTAQPAQDYVVSLNSYDAGGQWIAGNNLDWRRIGTGAWEEVIVDAGTRLQQSGKAAQVASVRLFLRPVAWSEKGERTGTTWFDNIQLLDENNVNLLSGSDFEPAPVTPQQVKLDFSAFDKAASRAFEKYKFTAFRLPLQGMGSGTFHARTPGRIGLYEEGSPEYETLFSSYIRQIQDHLEQKGWLDKAYIYWFDEPDPKDYEFVRTTMARIHRYAPKIRRMLTEQPEAELVGAVDLWCPITSHFDAETARERMRAGDEFWWYVCTVPKAPYATLFIDHPASELRTWLWQTWQHNVRGILVWESVYWTSEAAYPDTLQNPWQDPMAWVSGYSTPAGTRLPWGNGDGRFLYPPNRDPNTDTKPNFDAPINSIRWEMLREGIEDYEYFWTLREAVRHAKPKAKTAAQKSTIARAEALLTMPQNVTQSMTEFATSPAPMLSHRQKLAAAIEEVLRFESAKK